MGPEKSDQSTASRRDALKALAAATGAVTISLLPSRWAKPGLAVGALPAHAQTSMVLTCGAAFAVGLSSGLPTFAATSTVSISEPLSGVGMNYSVFLDDGTLHSPAANGTVNTVNGVATLDMTVTPAYSTGQIVVTWSFALAAQGSGSCLQIIPWFTRGSA